jgi:thiamine biosynthesis lipoprotein ApbE
MDIDVNRAWEVNTYDASAYGALLVILIAIIIYLGKKLSEKEKEIKQLYDKIHTITEVMSDKLSEIKTFTEISTEKNIGIKERILYILEDIKQRLLKIESDGCNK